MTLDFHSNNKRLAKNTMVLYVRTIVTMLISLYTSRVILEVLGVSDYGIYNVVGGFVTLFSIVSQTMVASTQRYLTFELGKGKLGHFREVYSTSLLIHFLLCIILVLLFETIGLWFLNEKLNIEDSRMVAANWIYQFSVISFIINIMRAPYEASIIAHECMSAFAYVNIFEALLKLLCLYNIRYISFDYLIQYGFYIMIITLLSFLVYYIYCKRNFKEVNFKFIIDKSIYKGMISFAGLNFWGSSSAIISNQGINILMNMFFGVGANAARGIAVQVGAAISKFVGDFVVSLNPQITKSYARGEIQYAISLVNRGAKFSFLMYMFFCVPIFLETPFLLKLWLNDVPEFTILFCRWTLASSLMLTYANPLTTLAFATGKIKKLSAWLGGVRLLAIPFVYLAYQRGLSIDYAYIICFCIDLFLIYIRLDIVCSLVNVSKVLFIKDVILRTILVFVLCLLLSLCIHHYLINVNSFFLLLVEVILICSVSLFVSYNVGLDKQEKAYIVKFIKSKI